VSTRIIENQCPIRLVEERRELAKGALAGRANSFLVDGMTALGDAQPHAFDIHFRGLQSHIEKRYLKPEILRVCNERTIFVRR
jgi:hypothetical protein